MLSTPQGKSDFMAYKRLIVEKRLREKFDNLVTSGIYTNALEGKYDFITANRKVNFNYAFKSYNDIDDSEVSVSDSDVKSYFRAHKGDDEFQPIRKGALSSIHSFQGKDDPIYVQIRRAEELEPQTNYEFQLNDNKMIKIAKMYKTNAENGIAKEKQVFE